MLLRILFSLKCSWSENGFNTISKSNIWNTQYSKIFNAYDKNRWSYRHAKLSYFTFKNGQETGTYFLCCDVILCVQVFYALPLRRNSEVKKISSDSESNSFANLSGISDENMMEEDLEDVKESLTHKLTSRVHVTWCFDRAIQMLFLKVK